MTLYILNLNGAEAGPFTEQQLRAMWLTGGVTVNTEWRLAPQGDWRSGAELSGAIGIGTIQAEGCKNYPSPCKALPLS